MFFLNRLSLACNVHITLISVCLSLITLKIAWLLIKTLLIPFNLNCTTPWNKKDTQEILKPYLKVLQNKTKIDLKKAIEIGNENGLNEIYFWNIDYEKRKLIWTLKSKLKNNNSKVIKINSKNGKVISEFIEITID